MAPGVGRPAKRDDQDIEATALERGDLLRDKRLGEARVPFEYESDPQPAAFRCLSDARDGARRLELRRLDPRRNQPRDVLEAFEESGHDDFARPVLPR